MWRCGHSGSRGSGPRGNGASGSQRRCLSGASASVQILEALTAMTQDFQSRVRSQTWSCARRSYQDARDERDEGLGRMTSSPTVQRGSSVAPAWLQWVQHGSLMARSGGQFRANSAVMQRSSNRPASEPPPVFIEGSGCCERAPRPGPLMLVDGLKIGARDHARAVIPVSAISVVAGARNHLPANRPLEFRFEIRLMR